MTRTTRTKPMTTISPGSSYYTVPWSWHLWVYNKYAGKESAFAKWMTKSFGKSPVLMSKVNPALRASIARSVLQNNGYFRGDVQYELVPQKNPKKCKIGYTVHLDSLYTLDSVAYTNFPRPLQALIDSTKEESLIRSGNAFSLASLDGERSRISSLFRNNGYYYYNSNYASYLADTFMVADKAQLRFQLANDLPSEALKKWYIGNINVQFRKSAREQLTDSVRRRHLTIYFNGKKPPIRPRIILKDLKLRPRQMFSYDNYLESANKINATGVFSSTDFQFTPRPDTDTLDLRLNCVLDKPYDFYIECNAIGRTNGRYGPEAKIGFTRRNLFHGGEKLDINLRNSTSTFTAHTSGSEAIVLTVPLINMVPMSASSSHASLHHSTIATVFAEIRTGAASVAVVSSRHPPPMQKCLPTLYAALNTTRCTLSQVSGLTAGNRRPQASTNTRPLR